MLAQDLPERYLSEIQQEEHRIIIGSMSMTYSEATAHILEALVEKAEIVTMLPDSFSLHFDDAKLRLNPFGTHAKNIRRFKAYAKALEEKGARVAFTNPYRVPGRLPLLNPYAGRSHDKYAIFGNRVYDFGGVDIKTTGFRNIESMVYCVSEDWADTREERAAYLYEHKTPDTADDLTYQLNNDSTVWVDTGKPGRSQFFKNMMTLLAEEDVTGITLLSQLRPVGEREKVLLKKQQELGREKVVVVGNRPEQLVLPGHIAEFVLRHTSQLQTHTLANPDDYLHEKGLLVYRKDQPTLLSKGTHNFHPAGIKGGTVEQMLVTTDTHLVARYEERVAELELRAA